jgi:hypothetical protein
MTNSKYYGADRGRFHVAESKGDCRISFVSNSDNYDYAVIDDSTYQSFLKVVSDLESRSCNKKEIMFSSGGGNVAAAIKIGTLINQKGYNTTLQLGQGCSSACGIVFIAGKERTALTSKTMTNSRIGFHQISKNKVCSQPSAPEYEFIEKYARKMLVGNNAENFISLMKSTSCKSMNFVSADELEKMGIATKLEPHAWGI